jgi:hypothetical protein
MSKALLLRLTASLLTVAFLFASCNTSQSDPFIGVWRYIVPEGSKDGSMDGVMATITMLEGTQQSYSMQYLRFNLTFTKTSNYTLAGVGSTLKVVFNPETEILRFQVNERDSHSFVKLK